MNSHLSFSFSKKIEKKNLQPSAIKQSLSDVNTLSEDFSKQGISTFDEKLVKRDCTDLLEIPLIEDSREAIYTKLVAKIENDDSTSESKVFKTKTKEDLSKLTLEERAVKELCQESEEKLECENNGVESIKLTATPAVSEKVKLDGIVSSLEDYEQISIPSFGAALLRGMGWKNNGVGTKRRVVNIIDPSSQRFGSIAKKKKTDETVDDEELKQGCYLYMHSGRSRGNYGIAESIDEYYILIQPARRGDIIREVEANIKVVSKEEYQEQSRVINKDMFDKFKEKEANNKKSKLNSKEEKTKSIYAFSEKSKSTLKVEDRNKLKVEDSMHPAPKMNIKDLGGNNDPSHCRLKSKHHKEKGRLNDRPEGKKKEQDKSMVHEDSSHYCDISKDKVKPKTKSYYEDSVPMKASIPIPWARENLRVRIISKTYKEGRYHKEKVIVQSVETVESCTCITDDGKYLKYVDPSCLETVIPKTAPAIVYIVQGSMKGQKAQILQLNKEKEQASLQLLEDNSVIIQKHYDDICEYVGR